METKPLTKDDVTYALFDIDPAAYYQERYAYHNVVGIAGKEGAVARNQLSYQKTHYLHEAFRLLLSETGNERVKVLEVGCGSGVFGARLKHEFPGIELHGVDMSSECTDIAEQNGFDQVISYDVVQGLPYADLEFDFIYTMDFFGHIEFRSKDRMIAELHRITKHGGYGFHGIESGFIDYLNCNPKDPEDMVRKYVYMEGHVGVETLEEVTERFAQKFEIVQTFPFPIRPLLNIANIMNSKFWDDDFSAAFAEIDSPASRMAADLVIGWFNKYLTDQLLNVYGKQLQRTGIPDSGIPALDRWMDALLTGCGFSMTTLKKLQI